LYAIFPADNVGNTNTFAAPATFESGDFNFPIASTKAASACNSPS
jgi:hypothetical protein